MAVANHMGLFGLSVAEVMQLMRSGAANRTEKMGFTNLEALHCLLFFPFCKGTGWDGMIEGLGWLFCVGGSCMLCLFMSR
jgi:hypothetical protein